MTNVLANNAIQCLDPQSGLLEMRNQMTASGTIDTLACGKDEKNILKLLWEIASAAVFQLPATCSMLCRNWDRGA